MKISTIGYEGLDIDTFLSMLIANGIDTVIDIRELPLSRKPGFSKKALANILNLSGLEYMHVVALGCPKSVRDQYREDGNWKIYTEGFSNYLKTQSSSIKMLSEMINSANCALLCYEADANFCHRSIVANAIKQHCNANINHIVPSFKKANLESHQLAFA